MNQAKVGSAKRVFCFDGAITSASLLSAVVRLGPTTVATLTFSAIGSIPNLYRSSEFTLLAAGQHEVVITYDGDVLESHYVVAEWAPASDFPLLLPTRLKLAPQELPDSGAVTARVVGPAGDVSGSLSALLDPQTAMYEAEHTFTSLGDHSVVWYQEVDSLEVPFRAERIFITTPPAREVIRFLAATVAGNGGTPHTNTTVVVMDEDQEVVGRAVTDQQGQVVMSLMPGRYTAALVKSGASFSTNNITFSVAHGVTGTQGSLVPLFTYARAISTLHCSFTDDSPTVPTCTLSATLYRMDGSPLRHAAVRVALLHRPELFGGAAVFDTDLLFSTDTNGRVQFQLVRGIQVEISIAPLSLRRIITVPDAAEANILTLMSQAPDLFEIVTPVLPAAAKRSL